MISKAVLFDFDGVVVKSMEQHFKAWRQAFLEKGVEIKEKEFLYWKVRAFIPLRIILAKSMG